MLRNITRIVAGVLLFIAGWTVGQMFESWAFFELDNSLNVSDVLGIIIECILAVFIVRAIGKRDEESRVEKEFYIQEYDKAQDIVNDIEKTCATETTLSWDGTNYSLARCRKIIVKLWKQISELHTDFDKRNKAKQTELQNCLNALNRRLTDTRFYEDLQGVDPLKITKGKIYLNGSIKPGIDDNISELKRKLLEMKILVNKM